MDLTRDPAAVISTWRRLAVSNLADLEPHPVTVLLFATHPPIPARLAHARQWAAEHRPRQP
jgi:STE24 endopeptidase